MLIAETPFDPADYPDASAQAALLNDALASRDPAFVAAAIRTMFVARGLALDVIRPDPSLGVVFDCLERLGVELTALVKGETPTTLEQPDV